MQLDASTCQAMVRAATAKAQSLGGLVSAAVVDSGGNLVTFLRMDGAEIAGPTLAVDKAYTAVANKTTTQELSVLAVPGGPLFGLHSNGSGRFVIFGEGASPSSAPAAPFSAASASVAVRSTRTSRARRPAWPSGRDRPAPLKADM